MKKNPKVENMNEVWEVLQTGSAARAVGSTNANELSSHSHWFVYMHQALFSKYISCILLDNLISFCWNDRSDIRCIALRVLISELSNAFCVNLLQYT